MRYLYILTIILAISIYADSYNKIELSETKKELSYEIFKKLEKEHYLRKIDKDNLNSQYFEAIFDRLDKNKNYFIANEVQKYLIKSKENEVKNFDIELAYDLINLYFERLIEYSEFQINLVQTVDFDFTKDEYLDIFYEDNQWFTTFKDLKDLWRLETKNDLLVAKISDSSSSDPKVDLVKRYQNRIGELINKKKRIYFLLQ